MAARDPDLDWDTSRIVGDFPVGRDTAYLLGQLDRVPVALTRDGARGPVLEVACGDASRACALAANGLAVVALEASERMLERARTRAVETGVRVAWVRGIAEALPFRSARFDRVLCESSLDHFADPARAIVEMGRVVRSDGRVIVGVANYGSPTVRVSRALYRAARRLGIVTPGRRFFWDSPVPHEHTFECTYDRLLALGAPGLRCERAVGVTIGWQLPLWGTALGWLPKRVAGFVLHQLARVARRAPRVADFVFVVWRADGAHRDDGAPGDTAIS